MIFHNIWDSFILNGWNGSFNFDYALVCDLDVLESWKLNIGRLFATWMVTIEKLEVKKCSEAAKSSRAALRLPFNQEVKWNSPMKNCGSDYATLLREGLP